MKEPLAPHNKNGDPPMSQAPQPMEIKEKEEDMRPRLGTWEKQTCEVLWGCPALLYTPSGAKMTITRDDKRIDGTEEYTAVTNLPSNCVCCCFPLFHALVDLPAIGLSKMLYPNAAEPIWGRHGTLRVAEKFTAEQALRPRQAKGKLKFVQNCDEGSKIVFRRTPMDRYTDTVCVVDEEGQTLGNPWTEVIAKDSQSMTQTFQVEGFQGPCTYVCCPYTQTVVWAKTSGSKEATPLLKGR